MRSPSNEPVPDSLAQVIAASSGSSEDPAQFRWKPEHDNSTLLKPAADAVMGTRPSERALARGRADLETLDMDGETLSWYSGCCFRFDSCVLTSANLTCRIMDLVYG